MVNHTEYMREWRKKNPEKHRNYCKKWREKNKEKIKEINFEYNKTENCKERKRDYLIKVRREQPIKSKARHNGHRKRDEHCRECNGKNNLHFHHTNYKLNKGYTLCNQCHVKVHKLI